MFIGKMVLIAGIVSFIIAGSIILLIGNPRSDKNINSDITISTYKGHNGYGYDVYVYGKLLIHQPHIPAISGNRGFATEADAQKVAELVVNKIKKNILPPSLTIEEMKDVGIVVE